LTILCIENIIIIIIENDRRDNDIIINCYWEMTSIIIESPDMTDILIYWTMKTVLTVMTNDQLLLFCVLY